MKTHCSIIKSFVLLLFVGIFSGTQTLSHAQIFNHLTPRDGITGGYINSIVEDSKGFLWIASNTGLDKYNGYEFENFRADNDDSTTISDSRVLDVLEYDETTFFIATQAGIDILNPATKHARRVSFDDTTTNFNLVFKLALENEHSLWAGVGNGLYLIDPTSLDTDKPDIQFFKNPHYDESIPSTLGNLTFTNDSTLWVGTNSGMFIFDIPSKTFRQPTETTSKAAKVVQSSVWKILKSFSGDIFIAADSGIAVQRRGETVIDVITELGELTESEIKLAGFQTISEDAEGTLWMGSGLNGALSWNQTTNEITHYRADDDDENSIQSDDVHLIFTGNQNEVWFGYHNLGLSLMYDRSWNYTIEQPFPELEKGATENGVFGVKEDKDGNLWLGTAAGLVYMPINTNQKRLIQLKDSSNSVYTLIIVENEIFGITSLNEAQTLFQFNIESEEFQFFENPLGVEPVTFLLNRSGDNILFPSNDTDILGFDTVNKQFYQKPIPQLAENNIESEIEFSAPLKDIDDNIFVIKLQFIQEEQRLDIQYFSYDSNSDEFTKSPAVQPAGSNDFAIPNMSRTESGIVYINLDRGLLKQNMISGESEFLFESEAGILSESNDLMIEDNDGYFWTNNSTGIMRLDPVTESISYFELENDRFDWYGENIMLDNGDLIFPGSNGLLRFNPDQLQEEDPISSIQINSLQTGDEKINTLYENHKNLRIESSNNNISFLYTGINYKEPAFTKYRYKLEGYSDDWNVVGTQRNVFIPNLPPADYNFQVQAASRFGGFTGPIAAVKFTVLPPVWRTIPAYILYFLILVGSVVSVDRFQRKRLIRLAREKSREKELEQAREIEKAYTNLQAAQDQLVQQEKLASLGQLTAGIAHEIKNPLNFVNNFSDLSIELLQEAREELEKTPADSKEALEIMKDIEGNLKKIHEHGTRADSIVKSMLQHSRGGSGKLEPTDLNALVSEYVNLSFHGMRAGKNPINVDIEVDLDESIPLIPLIGEDFSRVIINLCNNAFDAMRTKLGDTDYKPKLTVSTKSSKNQVIIAVEDNGPGIPEQSKDLILQPFFTTKKGTEGTGLGLSISNDIIKAHRGNIEIETEKNEFTRFKISLTQ